MFSEYLGFPLSFIISSVLHSTSIVWGGTAFRPCTKKRSLTSS
jgi:hypothetical protein